MNLIDDDNNYLDERIRRHAVALRDTKVHWKVGRHALGAMVLDIDESSMVFASVLLTSNSLIYMSIFLIWKMLNILRAQKTNVHALRPNSSSGTPSWLTGL